MTNPVNGYVGERVYVLFASTLAVYSSPYIVAFWGSNLKFMGDHRMSIKIKAEFHGIKRECDMWINYWPTCSCDMDQRVIDFFHELQDVGMRKYEKQREKYYLEAHAEEIEAKERQQLKILKKKYE